MLDPVAVALKFGFLAVLYLFLLWMARSALKDLRRTRRATTAAAARGSPTHRDAHRGRAPRRPGATPKLRVAAAPG